MLNTLSYTNTETTVFQVQQAVEVVSESINDLGDLSHSMNSETLLENGLVKALEFEVQLLSKSGKFMADVFTTGDPVFLEAETELVLFRIAQEAINNIIKHADATEVRVQLDFGNALLTMTITDNGNGISEKKSHNGTGLSNMKKRALGLKGKLSITSDPAAGTQVKTEIPIHE